MSLNTPQRSTVPSVTFLTAVKMIKDNAVGPQFKMLTHFFMHTG